MKGKQLLRLYHEMVLVRRLEERSADLYQQGKIGGFLHLYIGQEAVASGVISARKSQDHVLTAYRDHGVAIACGMPATQVMAELLGKATGCSKGMGGSMHLADVDLNFWGGYAIVGAHLPLAAGIAMADKIKGSNSATICFFGEGATNIGYFHEALNLSMVWDLPVLWVCENNIYGMGTSIERASAVGEMRQKAEGFGMPNARVDGMNVMAVRSAAAKALRHVRKKGPYFLEAVTYRFMGHSMGDPERYRSKEEVQKWRQDDPIGIFRSHILESGEFDESALDAQEEMAQQAVEEAVQFAEASPDPDPEMLLNAIYVDEAEKP
ncbi:MAG: pyruvate dehydrogenase (acetyl-transferring) E1 component subunit alpha [Anaerolineales bacterium]|jgi:pyruvate dehydrogenase E1 component alpha subunit